MADVFFGKFSELISVSSGAIKDKNIKPPEIIKKELSQTKFVRNAAFIFIALSILLAIYLIK